MSVSIMHLYDCLSEFEIGLRELIRREAPDWSQQIEFRLPTHYDSQLYVDKLADAKLSQLIEITSELGLEQEIRRDIDGYRVSLSDIDLLRGNIAHYNPIVHTMQDEETIDEPRRSAGQLAAEYRFLQDCIAGLPTPDIAE